MLRATTILGDTAKIVHPAASSFDLSGYDSIAETVVAVITRHPMRQAELEQALARWMPGQVAQVLAELAASDQAQVVERYGTRFWSAAPAHYPGEAHSQATHPARQRQQRPDNG